MNLTERQAEITDLLLHGGFLLVDALAEKYKVTKQTIRRDFNALCDYGLARRRHGGIEQLAITKNLAYQSRQILSQEAKQTIAKQVAKHIPNGASIAFSIGTTPEVVAAALIYHKNLRIFTNNLNIAMLFSTNTTFEVHIAGGRVRNGDCDVLGLGMESFLSSYMFDFGIYGVGGVAENGTLLDFTEEEVRARQLIHESSRTTILVLDHSKFGRSVHVRGGHISDSRMVFCDTSPPAHYLDNLSDLTSKMVICDKLKPK